MELSLLCRQVSVSVLFVMLLYTALQELSQIGQSRVSTYERYKVVRIIFKKNGTKPLFYGWCDSKEVLQEWISKQFKESSITEVSDLDVVLDHVEHLLASSI